MCLSLLGPAPAPHAYRRRWFAARQDFHLGAVISDAHSGFVQGVPVESNWGFLK